MTIEFVLKTLAGYTDVLTLWGPRLVVIGAGAYVTVGGLLLWSQRRWLQRQPVVWLEVTPPSSVDKTPEATGQLFTVIHGMREARSIGDRLLRRLPSMSFEITSTRSGGIRYLIRVSREQAALLEKTIASYLPDAKVRVVSGTETVVPTPPPMRVIEFKTTGHYVLPLTLSRGLDRHDPLSYVTGAMTKLSGDESITLQLVVQPVAPSEAARLAQRILRNDDVLGALRGAGGGRLLQKLNNGIGSALLGVTSLAGEVSSGVLPGYRPTLPGTSLYTQDAGRRHQVLSGQRPARTLSAFEQELMASMHQKITQPLFQVTIRVCISGDNAREHARALRSVLDGYSVPSYQSLRAKSRLSLLQRRRVRLAARRLPAIWRRSSVILSASELASLYHFPPQRLGRTDNLVASLSKTLPAPVSLKSGNELALVIGENQHHGTTTPIGLTAAERERHMYIIGGTGNGKTTMLFYSILQDIQAGNGVAVLDPHGDLAERLLRYIPEERIKDVIYMNPDDLSYPIGMNLLELDPRLTGDELLREKDLITEATISVLRKVFSDDDSGGHRIEYILRNAIQTALTLENPTLFTIFNLLNDGPYRRRIAKKLADKNLKDFWDNEIGQAGGFQRVKMASGITSKIGRFLFSASARRMLEQPRSTVNFEEILAGRKILIGNFSKGLLGEDTSALFGTTVLAKLQTAALRRARMGEATRTPYYLYVDEFQNFATTGFVQMLSEARKYKLFLTMAEQSTSQQDEQRLVNIILANVGTVVCFRSGSPTDEQLVLPLFMPFIQQGEIANLPAYSYYARIAAVHAQEPMSGVTVVVADAGSEAVANRVILSSRRQYAKKVEAVDAVVPKAVVAKEKRTAGQSTKKTATKKDEKGLTTAIGLNL